MNRSKNNQANDIQARPQHTMLTKTTNSVSACTVRNHRPVKHQLSLDQLKLQDSTWPNFYQAMHVSEPCLHTIILLLLCKVNSYWVFLKSLIINTGFICKLFERRENKQSPHLVTSLNAIAWNECNGMQILACIQVLWWHRAVIVILLYYQLFSFIWINDFSYTILFLLFIHFIIFLFHFLF